MAAAAQHLRLHYNDNQLSSLWIGKSLYTPHNVVRAAVLSALHGYAIANQVKLGLTALC